MSRPEPEMGGGLGVTRCATVVTRDGIICTATNRDHIRLPDEDLNGFLTPPRGALP